MRPSAASCGVRLLLSRALPDPVKYDCEWKVLLPDLTIVLDVAPEVARARVGPARDRIEDRPGPYHDRVRDGYLEAVRGGTGGTAAPTSDPPPIVLIDASADPQTVFERIQSEVERVLALDPRT